ncbi:hypothetical protein ACP70R_011055 [Stipagrostis hirtigluma subsp. patula]
MEKNAGEDAIEEKQEKAAAGAPAAKRRKTGAPSMCDDVLQNILARLPARAAVASMALSTRHRRLICSPEFRSLHRRLGPPLPRPHIAYVATAPIRSKGDRGPVSVFHGFHIAGAGLRSDAPMRAVFGDRFFYDKYVNTCDGVVLIAGKRYSPRCRCVLWNPAVADVPREVTIAGPSKNPEYLVLGFGHGRRGTYKILLSRKAGNCKLKDGKYWMYCNYSLHVYTPSDGKEQPRLRTVPSTRHEAEIFSSRESSLYMDGMIYILNVDKSVILAFDIDDETVTTIDLPGERDPSWPRHARSNLMEMSGHLCVATNLGHHRRAGLWLLTADRRWETRCVVELDTDACYQDDDFNHYDLSVAGIWECGGVMVLYLQGIKDGESKLCLYNVTSEEVLKAKLQCDLEPAGSEYALCWGYKPTLVSPATIVGELGQEAERRRNSSLDIMEALKPIYEADRSEGQKATLNIMCFMELLVGIMKKLPDGMLDVMKLPALDSEDTDLVSDNVVYSDSDSNADIGPEFEFVSDSDSDF